MSPCKGPVKDIKVKVPRHGSQRIGPLTATHVETIAKKKKQRVDVRQTAYDPSSILAQAVENASEWNSLLMTARAERGPQWDIGTQQFMVDEFSDLYYDPTPLREYEKEGKSEEPDPQTKTERHSMPAQDLAGSPQIRRGPHSSSQGPPMQFTNSPRHRPQMTPNMPFSNMPPVPAAQFYGNGDMGGPPQIRMSGMSMPIDQMGGMGGGMPGGMGGMGGMGPMANMGGMGGMPGMPGMGGMGGMGMPGAMGMPSPEMRRGMERRMSMGMGNDGFGGMH